MTVFLRIRPRVRTERIFRVHCLVSLFGNGIDADFKAGRDVKKS